MATRVVMAQSRQHDGQQVGVQLPIEVGSARFQLLTMPIWVIVMTSVVATLVLVLAFLGWTRPVETQQTAAPTATAPKAKVEVDVKLSGVVQVQNVPVNPK